MILFVINAVQTIWLSLSHGILVFSLLLSLAHGLGWIDRLVWYLAEQAGSEVWNGTPVTIGSIHFDIVRGRVWLTNVVIHTPNREEWKWKSPVICRIGKVYIESNWVIAQSWLILRQIWWYGRRTVPPAPLEIYTVEISDIQAFIERKQNIFNFYLMDPLVELPDPRDVLEHDERDRDRDRERDSDKDRVGGVDTKENAVMSVDPAGAGTIREADQCSDFSQLETSTSFTETGSEADEKKAQMLVADIMLAVKTLGVAARQGSWTGALVEHRDTIKSKLKQIQGTKNKTEAMQEGVRVIKRVGEAVARKTKEGVLPMPKRKEPEMPDPFHVRVGRVVIRDVRIFTRVNWTSNSDTTFDDIKKASAAASADATADDNTTAAGTTGCNPVGHTTVLRSAGRLTSTETPGTIDTGAWNKPIGIQEVVIRAAELCPSMSLLDENDLPAIYQPIEKVTDVIWKRVMAGMAKANTSHFLRTALGEVLDLEYLNVSTESSSDDPVI